MGIAIILLAIVFLVFKLISRNPKHRGRVGESKVANILNRLPNEYRVLNNVIIPARGSTSQIDHVVVSPYGIFVIETKNYTGWIFGSDKSERWKQTFKTTEGNYFRNPVKQNWGHVYALAEYLNLDKRVFRPIVVFLDEASLNTETNIPVIYMSELKRCILSYKQEIVARGSIALIFSKLSKANLAETDRDAEKRHEQSVKDNLARQERALRQGRCPRCGGDLILRKGRYGEFYGCSNYPHCKFTHNIR